MNKKGQISVELMVIVAFIVLLFIPLVLFVFYKEGEMNSSIESMQGRLISSKLSFIANALGSMGDKNSLKVEFSIPQTVNNVQFKSLGNGGEVLLILKDGSQVSQVTTFPFNSSKNYSGGVSYKLEFTSMNGTIYVSQSS